MDLVSEINVYIYIYILIVHVNLLKKDTKNADVVRTSLRKSAAVSGLIWTTVGT